MRLGFFVFCDEKYVDKLHLIVPATCVCVCVCERERGRSGCDAKAHCDKE